MFMLKPKKKKIPYAEKIACHTLDEFSDKS